MNKLLSYRLNREHAFIKHGNNISVIINGAGYMTSNFVSNTICIIFSRLLDYTNFTRWRGNLDPSILIGP